MWFRIQAFCVVALSLLAAAPGMAEQNTLKSGANQDLAAQIKQLDWKFGPTTGKIAGTAIIVVPEASVFLGTTGTRRFLELQGNVGSPDNFTFAPSDLGWFAVFSYDPSGHVPDDETIDPNALLAQLKQTNETANQERKQHGLQTVVLEDWYVTPHYDVQTRRLEWATRFRGASGEATVNYAIRLLGRTGVMSAILVSSPASLDKDIKSFKTALAGFEFNSGQKYAEFRAGDKVAEYGLAALIVGGAAAAAAKTGAVNFLSKYLGVIIAGGFTAAFAALRGFLARRQA